MRVDVPERGGEQGPDEEGAKGDAQHGRQDEAFVCTTKDRMAAISTAIFSLHLPSPLPALFCRPGAQVLVPVSAQPLTLTSLNPFPHLANGLITPTRGMKLCC